MKQVITVGVPLSRQTPPYPATFLKGVGQILDQRIFPYPAKTPLIPALFLDELYPYPGKFLKISRMSIAILFCEKRISGMVTIV